MIIQNNQKRKLWQNLWKKTLPKEYINTQKVTNGPNSISKPKPPVPKGIMIEKF